MDCSSVNCMAQLTDSSQYPNITPHPTLAFALFASLCSVHIITHCWPLFFHQFCMTMRFIVWVFCMYAMTTAMDHTTMATNSSSDQTLTPTTISPKLWTRMAVNPTHLQSQQIWGESFGNHVGLPSEMGTLIGSFLHSPVVTSMGQYFHPRSALVYEDAPGSYGRCAARYLSGKTMKPNSFIPLVHMRYLNLFHDSIRSMYLKVKVSKRTPTNQACFEPQYMIQTTMAEKNSLKYSPFLGSDNDVPLIGNFIHLKPRQWSDDDILGLYIPDVLDNDCEYVFDHHISGYDMANGRLPFPESAMFVINLWPGLFVPTTLVVDKPLSPNTMISGINIRLLPAAWQGTDSALPRFKCSNCEHGEFNVVGVSESGAFITPQHHIAEHNGDVFYTWSSDTRLQSILMLFPIGYITFY